MDNKFMNTIINVVMKPNEVNKENEMFVINNISIAMILFGILAFTLLVVFRVKSAYGRYSSKNWGFLISARLGWMLQEVPVVIWGIWELFYNDRINHISKPALILSLILFAHYINRSFIFPLRINGKPSPILIVLFAFVFCVFNGFIQFRFLTRHATYSDDYIWDPKFIIGIILCFSGIIINFHSDHILLNLRKGPHDKGYYIPYGGMFRFVSGANFFGEILEWTGWAIASWHYIPATFALFTFLNTAPRGWQHHQNYLEKFKGEYPSNRKAVIPFIW